MHRTSDAQTTSTFEAAYRVLAEADGERTLVALLGATAAGPPRVPLKPAVPEPLVEQPGAFRERRLLVLRLNSISLRIADRGGRWMRS